ncbi:MAG: hypothetical protein AABP62_29700 [Planctomycetota bacterium]
MTLTTYSESAEIIAKVIQAAVDRVKSPLVEPICNSPGVALDGASS